MTRETMIKSALKYLVKMQIEGGSVGFAVDNDPDHDCCWDDVLAWIETQPTDIAWVVGNDGAQVAFKNMPVDKAQQICAIIGDEAQCKDCISRQAVIDQTWDWESFKNITRRDGLSILKEMRTKIEAMPSVTPSYNSIKTELKPCEDYISREEGIKGLTELINNLKGVQGDMGGAVNSARELIKTLPPVIPQRKRGKWNFIGDQMFECSSCKRVYTQNQFEELRIYTTDDLLPKFCPNCSSYNGGGADADCD